jgi:hypothetical protein
VSISLNKHEHLEYAYDDISGLLGFVCYHKLQTSGVHKITSFLVYQREKECCYQRLQNTSAPSIKSVDFVFVFCTLYDKQFILTRSGEPDSKK